MATFVTNPKLAWRHSLNKSQIETQDDFYMDDIVPNIMQQDYMAYTKNEVRQLTYTSYTCTDL